MRFGQYILRRLLLLVPQLLGISLITFVLIHLMPGDPAYTIAGSLATEQNIRAIQHRMGLDQPLPVQYVLYLQRLSHGDLGDSYIAGRPVRDDLAERLPATVELITISFVLAVAIPDFWLALILAFVFYFQLRWLPAPIGQLDIAVTPPPPVTGMLLIDSLIAGDGEVLRNHLGHLILPVATLTLLYAAPILKMTRSSMDSVLGSGFVRYSRAAGLPTGVVVRYALRNALSPVVTLVGVLYSILLSGAVLVEQVYGWGGAGQYAVQSILNSDYLAIQGFV